MMYPKCSQCGGIGDDKGFTCPDCRRKDEQPEHQEFRWTCEHGYEHGCGCHICNPEQPDTVEQEKSCNDCAYNELNDIQLCNKCGKYRVAFKPKEPTFSELAEGCGNHGCLIKKPTGMATNGRCRCVERIYDRVQGAIGGQTTTPKTMITTAIRITIDSLKHFRR